MAASSSTSAPLIPSLLIPYAIPVTPRNQPASVKKFSGKIISRSLSQQPCEFPLIIGNSPKKSVTSFFLSDSANEEFAELELRKVQKLFRQFFRAVDSINDHSHSVLVISNQTKKPDWRDLSLFPGRRGAGRRAAYIERSEKALWNLVSSIGVFIDLNKDSFDVRIKDAEGSHLQNISVCHLLDKLLTNDQMRDVVNRKELLRHRIAKCYLKISATTTYSQCSSIVQTLNDFEKFSLISSLASLRRLAKQKYIQNNPLRIILKPFEFYGYSGIFKDVHEEESEIFTQQLNMNPEHVLTFDGAHIDFAEKFILSCRDEAQIFIEKTQQEGVKDQPVIARGEKLSVRISNSLNLYGTAALIRKFEVGFRGFIESNLIFLERHFAEDLSEFHADLNRYRRRLDRGLSHPFDWRNLRTLVNLLNSLVSKILRKHNVARRHLRSASFIGTPRSILPL